MRRLDSTFVLPLVAILGFVLVAILYDVIVPTFVQWPCLHALLSVPLLFSFRLLPMQPCTMLSSVRPLKFALSLYSTKFPPESSKRRPSSFAVLYAARLPSPLALLYWLALLNQPA